jgi:hypothetical protein
LAFQRFGEAGMSELTGDEPNLVRDLLEEAEDKAYSRERFRAIA